MAGGVKNVSRMILSMLGVLNALKNGAGWTLMNYDYLIMISNYDIMIT